MLSFNEEGNKYKLKWAAVLLDQPKSTTKRRTKYPSNTSITISRARIDSHPLLPIKKKVPLPRSSRIKFLQNPQHYLNQRIATINSERFQYKVSASLRDPPFQKTRIIQVKE